MLKWEITLLAIISTHTLTWSVTISPLMLQQNTLFQLTRSRGAWPAESCNVATNEGDFNSHAHVERDPEWKDLVKTEEFQLTRSRGAWRKRCWYGQADFGFQLTRSRGAWHSRYYFNRSILKFQLTRSRGAWLGILRQQGSNWKFQLTRSRGAWQEPTEEEPTEEEFQLTRSRGAWLQRRRLHNLYSWISTHTLTWSVTGTEKATNEILRISTHTLTWSVTKYRCHQHPSKRFQLTRSRGAWRQW